MDFPIDTSLWVLGSLIAICLCLCVVFSREQEAPVAENPETWDEIDKAILALIKEHEAEVLAGVCGNTLQVKIGNYVRQKIKEQKEAATRVALDHLIALDKATWVAHNLEMEDAEAKRKARHDQMLIDGGGA